MALLGFVIALAAEVVIFALHPDQVWYEGRAAAESARTLSWRYAVAGGPFPVHLGEREADTAFLTQLLAVTRDLKSSFPPPAPGGMSQVTDEMRALRSKSFAERKSVYLSARIDDQREWYGAKSRAADRHNTVFLLGQRWLDRRQTGVEFSQDSQVDLCCPAAHQMPRTGGRPTARRAGARRAGSIDQGLLDEVAGAEVPGLDDDPVPRRRGRGTFCSAVPARRVFIPKPARPSSVCCRFLRSVTASCKRRGELVLG